MKIFYPQKALPCLRPHLLVFSVKNVIIGVGCSLVEEPKTKKPRKKTFWLSMLGMHRSHTAFGKTSSIGVGVRLDNVITLVEFGRHRLTGLDLADPQNLVFTIHWLHRPYNNLTDGKPTTVGSCDRSMKKIFAVL